MNEDFDDEPERGPSKSQLKREAHALQALGERLTRLKPGMLDGLPLPPELRAAVDAARAMSKREARRRQLQFIGKLMRRLDADPIRQALDSLDAASLADKRRHHALEDLVAALLAGDEARLGEFLDRHPATDRQHLRQLLRKAQREQQEDKPPAARRALFRYLRDVESGP